MTQQQHTYLELSEEGEGAHKFYSVTTEGTRVTISYGRIGVQGQTTVADFADEAKALAAATKKIQAKLRKGYAPAVRGERARRAVTRRQITSTRSTAAQAPVLWKLATGAPAFGIFVDDERCWVGNESGDVYTVAHDGAVTGRFRLPDGVKCLVADDFWIYAGCDDGKVYDLAGKVPRVAYEIAADVDIYWIDIHDALLGVSDRKGRITTIDHEDEYQWARDTGGTQGWMVRVDGDAVYHGHSKGVSRYRGSDGAPVWTAGTGGAVLFGWQEEDSVYAGTARGTVVRLSKEDGREQAVYRCDAAVFSCATSPGGKHVFAGDNSSSVYCFAEDGTRLWKLATGCGSAFSMQYHGERLYIVTTDGHLTCIDASETAIAAAQRGSLPAAVDLKVAASMPAVEPTTTVTTVTTRQNGTGVLIECFQDGARLRMRVIEPGYDSSWNVQFPKGIRESGARYVVEGVRISERGGFYRAYGEVKRLL